MLTSARGTTAVESIMRESAAYYVATVDLCEPTDRTVAPARCPHRTERRGRARRARAHLSAEDSKASRGAVDAREVG